VIEIQKKDLTADNNNLDNNTEIKQTSYVKNKKMQNATFNYYENQKELLEYIENDMSKKDAVIWIDMDGFTYVNKKYGKNIADLVIAEMESIIQKITRVYACTLYHAKKRDDFLIAVNHSHSEYIGNQILKQVNSYNWGELAYGMYIHCSVGIGKEFDRGNKAERSIEVLKKARLALNFTKSEGRNKLHIVGSMLNPKIYVRLHSS
jgi:GGDEF domain-containing protein